MNYNLKAGSDRLLWIDIAKIIGIYLMIIGHQNLLDENTTRVIFSFHMPFFFCISGMFWRQTPFIDTLIKTYKTLIVQFLLHLFFHVYYVLLLVQERRYFQ